MEIVKIVNGQKVNVQLPKRVPIFKIIKENLSMKINEPLEYVRRLYYLCFSK
jgi:hypothetical protein